MKNFYVTTTLPYVNAKPHIGFGMEIVRADVVARYKRAQGYDVFFNTGTDEHGTKIFQKAAELGIPAQQYVDEACMNFKNLKEQLNISYDKFTRTTDPEHIAAAQEFWKRCNDAGFIYKKKYSGLYCVGCEMFIPEKDLVNGECPMHPGRKLEYIEEENYFFKYSAFAPQLLELYKRADAFTLPASRLNEITSFVKSGLEDFSISRLASKMPWGIPVPGDSDHVMYVWFDALTNYISTLGWPNIDGNFEKFWLQGTPVQYCGKDNLQHQSARWQAMLMAAGVPASHKVIVNGFILGADGQKMSKSIGNVVDPLDIVNEYGIDAFRYMMTREIHPFEDTAFGLDKCKEIYNAHLANGLGNVVSRVMKMSETHIAAPVDVSDVIIPDEYHKAFEAYNLQAAANIIWHVVGEIDQTITDTEPFKLVKTDKEKACAIITDLVKKVHIIATMLVPFMPDTAEKILASVRDNKKPGSLFARKD